MKLRKVISPSVMVPMWQVQQSDFEFSSLDIGFSKEFAQLYERIYINATIYNSGNQYIENLTINLYEIVSENTEIYDDLLSRLIGYGNPPELNLIKKETFNISAQSFYVSTAVWFPGISGLPKIYVVLDYNAVEKDGYIGEGYREIIVL